MKQSCVSYKPHLSHQSFVSCADAGPGIGHVIFIEYMLKCVGKYEKNSKFMVVQMPRLLGAGKGPVISGPVIVTESSIR